MKRFLVVLIMILFGFGLFGCNSYEYKEDDFKCKISVDKTNVKIGDTINVKVIFENVSSQDIKLKLAHTDQKSLKDIILIELFESDERHDFIVNSKGGNLIKTTFKQGDIITKELAFEINNLNDNEIQALVTFYIGQDYNQKVSIYSDIIKIIVEG